MARDAAARRADTNRVAGALILAAYIATIWLANYLVEHYGIVTVPFSLQAPAGVYAAGLALVLRNGVQRTLGRRAGVLAIIAGALLSYTISPTLALASGVAFLFSEAADFLVYTPLESSGRPRAALAGATIGAAVDSALFLQIAFGDLTFWSGQFVGKMAMILLAVAIWALIENPHRWTRAA